MNPYALPPFLAAVLNFTLVYWVYHRAPAGTERRTFLLWNTWIGLWNSSIAVGYLLTDAFSAYLWYKITLAPVVGLITPFFLRFVVIFTESTNPRTMSIVRLSYLSGIALAFLGGFTPLILGKSQLFFWGYYMQAGKAEWLVGLCYVSQVTYAFWLLLQAFHQTHGQRRNQIKYMLLGTVICFTSGMTNFLPLFGVAVYPMGNLMNSLYSLVVAYTIVEHELMDMQIVLRRGTVYGLLSGGLTLVYVSLVTVLQRLFGHYGVQESVAFYTAAFPITVILAPTMKSRIEPFVDHALFGGSLRAEKLHLQNQDMALMGILATEMAHELAKPLTHIMNAGSRLENSIKGQPRENLRTIEKEVQRASEILDGFAMLSPERTLHRIAVPLTDLVEEAVTALALSEDKSLEVVRRFRAMPATHVNPGQIVQVLTNLIQNAWQAMPGGGRLTLSVHPVASRKDTTHAEINITDTGRGIAPNILQKVYEPFFTTKQDQGGHGMGLTISRAMVERHGGTIEIQSPVTAIGGTRVVVRLPIHPSEESNEK